MLLKKEVNKTHTEGDSGDSGNYRQVRDGITIVALHLIIIAS